MKWFTEYDKMLLFVNHMLSVCRPEVFQKGMSCSPGPGIISGIGPEDNGEPNEKGEGEGSGASLEFILDPSFTGASERVS